MIWRFPNECCLGPDISHKFARPWSLTSRRRLANECEISGPKLYECGNCVPPHLQTRRLFGSFMARDTSLFTRVVGVLGKFTLLNVYRGAKVIVTSPFHCVVVRHNGVAGPWQHPVTIVLLASHWLKTIEVFSAARNWDESSQTVFSLPVVGERLITFHGACCSHGHPVPSMAYMPQVNEV